MKRLLVLFAALSALLLFHGEALASHFRYGTVNWVVPDPQAAPNTVKFTVTYGIVFGSPVNLRTITLNFGDGSDNGAVAGPIVGTGTDAGGAQYEVREFTATHTYAAPGNYTAFFVDCCRINTLINGSGLDYRVEAKVVLQPGNTSGPVSASPPLIQLQIGGTRMYTWPAIDPDADPVTCRFATEAEVGFPNPTPAVPNPPGPGNGGQTPTLANVPNGCQLSWNLIDAVAGQRYVVHVVFESTHSGQLSSTALDLIVEMITPPPPVCAGSNVFITDVGQLLSTMVTGTNNVASNLTVSAINAPLGSTLLPGGAAPSPFTNTFSWTPLPADRGTTRIVVVNYTNTLNHTGTCFLTVQVPQCADFGDPCSAGVGECQNDGTKVCAGFNITVCNAVAGLPSAEICGDGLDQNCNNMIDDGCVDSDGDGLFDDVEDDLGSDPNDKDSDDDGVLDGAEQSPGEDTDGDGLINILDPDSDNDGLFDGTELGLGCMSRGTDPLAGNCVADGDMGATKTDPLDADTDNGGVNDGAEDSDLDGQIDVGETDPTAGNGADDSTNTDTDGDGLTDDLEEFIGTDPNDADSDDDGTIDGLEANPADDTDGDGLINALDPDSDDDGLFDGTEQGFDCSNPATNPAAGTCTADADTGTYTSPLDPDTDGGGVIDGAEDLNHNGKLDVGEIDPTAGHGADDSTLIDTDGDGLPDVIEILIGTDPNDADSDDDGVIDGDEANFNQDSDGDGAINALDPDSDNDGLFDGTEVGITMPDADTDVAVGNFIPDADPATKTSPLLADTDGGGAVDGAEDANHNGKLDAGERNPTAGNGADDFTGDTDGDGLSDVTETMIGTDPNDADSDDDGVRDGLEIFPGVDSDGDGLINALDPDSDNDGLFDGTEMGVTMPDADTNLAFGNFIADADPLTRTNPLDADTDDGGVKDGAEDVNHNGKLDLGELDPTLGHGADDVTGEDTDGDGLTDDEEDVIGTDKNDADSDDDGVIDGNEANPTSDTDGDGLINALDPDSDNDGLFDGTEVGLGCGNPDTDASKMQCTADVDPSTKTSPLLTDTDGGGVSDGNEDSNKNGKVDDGERDPTIGHGGDDLDGDTDGDGLTDGEEEMIGTDPMDADSDDDGTPDGSELDPGVDTDGDGLINALDPDSDNDGLFDGTEQGFDCSGPGTNQGAGHCTPDGDEGATVTDPTNPDTDGGGASDGSEDVNGNGTIDPGETDPTLGHGGDDSTNIDTDGDGLTDKFEDEIGTDKDDADSDDDGVIDGLEPNPADDTDGDGKINALDPDSDDDGLFDGTEMGLDCEDDATDVSKMNCIADGDMGTTKTSPVDPDTDDGGVIDGAEDQNHNGVVDGGETDPTTGHGDDDVTTDCKDDAACGDATSGMVCNLDTGACETGCHTPGNGCPGEQVCTSDDATIGECVECVDDKQCGGANSGRICHLDTNACADGCSAEGNGCPNGFECSLPGAQTVGVCKPTTEEPDGVIAEGSGLLCSMRAANDNNSSPLGWFVPLALGGLLAARRRRQR